MAGAVPEPSGTRWRCAISHRCDVSVIGLARSSRIWRRSPVGKSATSRSTPYSAPNNSSASAAIWLWFFACKSWNLRRAWAMQPSSVMPAVNPAVARVIVGDQFAAPIFQERAAVLARPTGREVVEHCSQAVARGRCVRPQVGPVRLARARLEHLHRRLVGMQHGFAQHFGLEHIDQRLQPQPAHADPLAQRRARQSQAGARKDAFLAI